MHFFITYQSNFGVVLSLQYNAVRNVCMKSQLLKCNIIMSLHNWKMDGFV